MMFFDEFKKKYITWIWITIKEYEKNKKTYDELAKQYNFNKIIENDKIWFRR